MTDGPVPSPFDGAFIGPLLPPPPPRPPSPRDYGLPEPTEALLGIPLGVRALVGQALDLLTRSDSGLRAASYYIGFLMVSTAGPVLALLVLGSLSLAGTPRQEEVPAWLGWLVVGAWPGIIGYIGASVEARVLATAVIGGRAEGRPLRLRESIAVARRRFWQVLGAQVIVGIIAGIAGGIAVSAVDLVVGPIQGINFAVSLLAGLLVGAPFGYAASGIVLGEADLFEALRRSVHLARVKPRLALVVAAFASGTQFLLLLGVTVGADVAGRVVLGLGIDEGFPPALVIPVVAALVFAFGTLMLLVEAIAAAPAVFAFEALTQYTAGLEQGRREPLSIRWPWDPWFTPGLAVMVGISLAALAGAVLALPR